MCRDDDEGLGDDDDLSILPQMQCVDKVVAVPEVMQKQIPGFASLSDQDQSKLCDDESVVDGDASRRGVEVKEVDCTEVHSRTASVPIVRLSTARRFYCVSLRGPANL